MKKKKDTVESSEKKMKIRKAKNWNRNKEYRMKVILKYGL